MKLRTYIEDVIDVISLVMSVIIALAITGCIKSGVDPALAESRGNQAIGGEIIIYGLIVLGVSFILFQVFTAIGHKIEKM